MKTKLIYRRGRIALVIDDQDRRPDERDVLAAMTLYEGTGCWQLVDIRLSKHRRPSVYAGSLNADVICASFKPENECEAMLAKSMLREYQEEPDGTLLWCSFDGVVRGSPEVGGYRPPSYADFDQAGYFSKVGGLAKLAEIKAFWDGFEGDFESARIDNPHRQPSEGELSARVLAKTSLKLDEAEQALPTSPRLR